MTTYNGNALQLAGKGILIIGPSNAGKSVLTLALIERSHLAGRKAVLVSDDYVIMEHAGGQLFASVPPQIAGAMEIRGAGLFQMDYADKTRLDLVVELTEMADRFPGDHVFSLYDVNLPLLRLPRLGLAEALTLCHAVEATLFGTRWQPEFSQKNE